MRHAIEIEDGRIGVQARGMKLIRVDHSQTRECGKVTRRNGCFHLRTAVM